MQRLFEGNGHHLVPTSPAALQAQDSVPLRDYYFRVLGRIDRLNRAGQGCTRLELGCIAGTATAVLRHDHFLPRQRDVNHGDIVRVFGELRMLNGRNVIKIGAFKRLDPGATVSARALLPREWVLPLYIPDLRAVVRHWEAIGHAPLSQFLSGVFSDASTAMGFLNAPGSYRHHHAHQGGLLEHSADMLRRFEGQPLYQCPGPKRDLATVLILLHDIGKTVTLVGSSCYPRGARQPHEMAGLEMMAAPLAQLEMVDPEMANLIRGFFKPGHWAPRHHHAVYRLVSALDRQSADITLTQREWQK
ncbi:hypothetical protein NCG89_03010 [Spongiibacter taiwanensis]|uniref:hypothetical protein n=1 Tax=Spongiibacter taiwanensis TaxID=1748242 RepID=UPI002034F8E9|nr:hypothetical protein [Spongiibacter taiwanensis]USA43765.1 hypothetical protein NCG89_03010 [Spongiibacter taiwanensis]